jgi:hypothetical protein
MIWALVQALALVVAAWCGGVVFWALLLAGDVPPLALVLMAAALALAAWAEGRA